MLARLRSWRQQMKTHPVVTILVILGIPLVVLVILGGYRLHWEWTGFFKRTLWDWLQLLIVPLVLAAVALVFQLANTRTERQITKQRYEQDQQIALDKQHEDLLQGYLDRMTELLLEKHLRTSQPDDEVRNVARARTITVLTQLDRRRIGYVFAFLEEAGLMSAKSKGSVVNLGLADFHLVEWSNVNLNQADLRAANLSYADLTDSNLSGALLVGANFRGAFLDSANLVHAVMISANLSEAMLSKADLRFADLNVADLSGANLKDASGITIEELEKQTKSLKGATMPNGSIHP